MEKVTEEKMYQDAVLEMAREKQITASKGAELLGMPLQDFLELMSKHHIPVLDYDSDGIDRDLKTLGKVFAKAGVSTESTGGTT